MWGGAAIREAHPLPNRPSDYPVVATQTGYMTVRAYGLTSRLREGLPQLRTLTGRRVHDHALLTRVLFSALLSGWLEQNSLE